MAKKAGSMQVRIIKSSTKSAADIAKAETTTQIDSEGANAASEWITPAIDLKGLKALVSQSAILPQCIRAYKSNIAGFGIGVRYKDDTDETPEMKTEYAKMEEIIELLNTDMDTKELFEDAIEAREKYGIAYIEVVRNLEREITSIEFIKDTPSVKKTMPLDPHVEVEFSFKGQRRTRRRKFCKYRQEVGPKTMYFKEVGDPRIMDKLTGKYEEQLDLNRQANEIMELAIGTETYGEVRWIGQVLGIDGSRKAENLNNNYFDEGRHTPLLIVVKGGTLTDDSFSKLQEYMDGIKGEAGQHAFMILETESTGNRTDFTDEDNPDIEIKDLASILQNDELFQEYIDNNRRRVQSAFLLPDLYVGYTTDFNRATAQTAMEVTEKQVFQPERRSLAWAINNKLLKDYEFNHVEAYFIAPDITNPEDLQKILSVTERAGGLTPNKAKEITYSIMGETAEAYEGDWADVPLAITRSQIGGTAVPVNLNVLEQLEGEIKKALKGGDDAVVAVMKEVRSLLVKMQEGAA